VVRFQGGRQRRGPSEDKDDVRRSDPVRTRAERDEDDAHEDEDDALRRGRGTSKAQRPWGPGARDVLAGWRRGARDASAGQRQGAHAHGASQGRARGACAHVVRRSTHADEPMLEVMTRRVHDDEDKDQRRWLGRG
jgi:hypothetical protein